MGTLVRNERSSGTPRGVPGARRLKPLRRRDIYIPIPTSGRTVPYHRSFIKLFCFVFFVELGEGILIERTRIGSLSANGGLLINSQGICCPRAVVSCPSEPRGNGLERLLDALGTWLARAAVQLVSPGRNTRSPSNNYAEISRVFFCLHDQFCKGDER